MSEIPESEKIKQQIEMICIERGLEPDEVMKAIEVAIASAYRKEFGDKDKNYQAKYDLNTGKYSVWEIVTVVEGEAQSPAKEIGILEAKLFNPNAQVGDVIKTELEINHLIDFGRISSQIARQVLYQAINSVRHSKILQKFKDRVGDIVNVEIDFFRKGGYVVKIDQTTGFISKENLLPIDRFKAGQLVKALIVDISEDDKGNTRVLLSRTHPNYVVAIIKNEVPEVANGIVTIDKVVREAGSRTKILVSATEYESIDPVGTILGRKNVRLINIMREISNTMMEKIDVIENIPEDLELMIIDALEPAQIERVDIDLVNKKADVYCYQEEASLAVGKRGVNIRLASELVGLDLNLITIDQNNSNQNLLSDQDIEGIIEDEQPAMELG
jgi:N utilization substance protein A